MKGPGGEYEGNRENPPSIPPPSEKGSDRWKGVLRYAAMGFGLAVITSIAAVEVGMVGILTYLHLSGQLPQPGGIQEILSHTPRLVGAGVLLGVVAGPWMALTLGYAKYHSLFR